MLKRVSIRLWHVLAVLLIAARLVCAQGSDPAATQNKAQPSPSTPGISTTSTAPGANAEELDHAATPHRSIPSLSTAVDANAEEPGHVATPYRSIPSLRDLYTQFPSQNQKLERFGADFFRNGSAQNSSASDLPAGPDYILGIGDELDVNLWGAINQHLSIKIDREGKIALPEIGSVSLAGRRMGEAQKYLESTLRQQLNNVSVNLALVRIRTVRVYVVGDVARPGAYDISALSTPLNAVYAAGGPAASGSMRLVRHFRTERMLGETDLYDLMLRGLNKSEEHFESGDTVLVPSVGQQVTVAGLVRRPAIYELRDEHNLAEVLALAGGIPVSGDLKHITIERVQAHAGRTMVEVNVPTSADASAIRSVLESSPIQDGDRITILPIAGYSDSAVYLDGHVFFPGKYSFHLGMTVTDLVRSFRDLLPEAADDAEVIRLTPPDNHPNSISIHLSAMLKGAEPPAALEQFDTVRVHGRYEIDAPLVSIFGEVARPGSYPMSEGMTCAALTRFAGGLLHSATSDRADLSSYEVRSGTTVVTGTRPVEIGKALAGVPDTDVRLHPNDVLTVRRVSGWDQIGASIVVRGEVAFPGTYGILDGERLSSILKRAGGLLPDSYPQGAVLERVQVKELAERRKQELIQRIRSESAIVRQDPRNSPQDQAAITQSFTQQQQQIIEQLQSQPVAGRLVIHLAKDGSWEGTPFDIEVRSGDQLVIPKVPGFVSVGGQAFNVGAFTFIPGKKAKLYLSEAGGTTNLADSKNILVISVDGSVASSRSSSGILKHSVLDVKLHPGDTIFVPGKVLGGSQAWKNVLQIAQVTTALAIATGVALHF